MFENIVLPVIAAVLAGLGWSTVGIWSKWRSGSDVNIDTGKLKKNVIIGAVVGALSWAYVIATAVEGDIVPVITTVPAFIAATIAYFPIIVIVDKLLIRKDEQPETEEFFEEDG